MKKDKKVTVDGYAKFEEITSANLLKIVEVVGRANAQLSAFQEIADNRQKLKDEGENTAELALVHIQEITEELKHLDELLGVIVEMAEYFEKTFIQTIKEKAQTAKES
ncbi:hypothetical protein A1D22_02570 [Pasteurellaceae bacterium LFhippo2]|nr:hypothetical protein [Pasteurellaceae bacterium LFhippo2]